MERLQRFGFLADAEEFNRLAGDMANRQRRAAAGVAVHFGQHHAGQRQRFVKGLRGIRRILAGHRIDDKQGFNRINGGVDVLDFVHHRFVNVQTTGGIHQQHVVEFEFRFFQRRIDDIHRLLADVRREEIDADLLSKGFQLFDRRRAVNVRGNDQHFLLVLLAQEFPQLTDAGGFTGTLQARHQHHGRRLRGQVERLVLFAHRRHQLVADDFDELLTRGQAFIDFMADRALFHAADEITNHRKRNVRFQQRHAHFAQGVFNIVFCKASAAANVAQRTRQTIG